MIHKKITQAIGPITKNPDINYTACLTKIYRTMKTDKKKRGKLKELRNRLFTIAVSTTASTLHLNLTSQMSFQN